MTTRYDKEVESSFSPDATKWQLGSSQSDIRLKLNENRKYTYSLLLKYLVNTGKTREWK